jgi:orotidine-5'-phosphate decarboxylase
MRADLLDTKIMEEGYRHAQRQCYFYAQLNGNVFEDVKLDDIPNTVGRATKQIARWNPKMLNIHASCGIDAMFAVNDNKGAALAIAVTVLTSREENDALLTFGGPPKAKVLQFAREAKLAGMDGVVCSPQELKLIKSRRELNGLLTVVPGIREHDAPPDDQKRTMTAAEAVKAGADWLVIGRPITQAADPVEAAKHFAEQIASARK